ncbi:hypothetical protein ACTA71_005260 [Dictyostelium dimigraforme]
MKYLLCVDGSKKARQAVENTLKFVNKGDELYFVSVYPPHPNPNENNEPIDNSTIAKMVIEMFSGVPDLVDPDEEKIAINEQILISNHKKVNALEEFHYFKNKHIATDNCNIHYLLVASNDISGSITDVANKYGINCVVLGSTGTSLEKLLIGSVSSKVLSTSHCSVLISP